MRAVLLAFALILGKGGFADCAGPMTWAYPEGKILTQGQALMVEGYVVDHTVFMTHMRGGKVHLRTGDTSVPLRFVTGHKGQFHLSQAMFLPTSSLEEGRTYTLYIDDLPASIPQPRRWDRQLHDWLPITWTIVAVPAERTRSVAHDATVIRSTLVHYGCGPATHVYVSLGSRIPNGTWCEVRLADDEGKSSSYILPMMDGLVAIGHGMCSGAFGLIPGERYTAAITLLRADGQALPESLRSVSFAGPTEETTEE